MSIKMKDGIFRRGKTWWIQYTATAPHRCRTRGDRPCPTPCPDAGRTERRVIRESTGSTRRGDAKTALAGKRTASARGSLVPDARRVTLEDLERLATDRYIADGRRAVKRLELCWKALRAGLPGLAVDVTTEAVDAYERQRLAAGRARGTVNNELACLRRAFNLAIERGRLDKKPLIKTKDPHNARTGVVAADALRAILAKLPAWAAPVVEFLALTGWRVSEAIGLTWAHVDKAGKVVRLEAHETKAGRARTFPFGGFEALERLLARQRAAPVATGWVFNREGGGPIIYKELRLAWRSACRKAKAGKLIMHDLRRTAASNLVAAGVDEGTIMRLCGWETRAMFDRYHIVSEDAKRAAVAKYAAALHPAE